MWPFKRSKFSDDAPERAQLLLAHGEMSAIAALDALETHAPKFEAITLAGLLEHWIAVFSVSVATVAMTEVGDTVRPSQQESTFETIKGALDQKNPKAYNEIVLPLLEELRSVRSAPYDAVIGAFVLASISARCWDRLRGSGSDSHARLIPSEPEIVLLAAQRDSQRLVGHFVIAAGHNYFANDRKG
jgi:hypothetical protein